MYKSTKTKISVMYLRVLALVVVLLFGISFQAYAFPIVTTEEISEYYSSQYQDGVQINGSGTVFTLYRELPGGDWQDLLLDATTAQTRLEQGEIELAGYNNNTNQWESCTALESGEGLTPHITNYGWYSNYTLAFDGFNVGIDVQLAFDWSYTTLAVQEQQEQMEVWESGIEDWWNNQYVIVKDGGDYIFDIMFDVTFDGYDDGQGGTQFDQTVTVKPGDGRANMTTWYLGTVTK